MAKVLHQRGGDPTDLHEAVGRPSAVGRRPRTAGMRRVDWVRLTVDEQGTRAEVVGVAFRLPVTRPVPLSLAARLIASGTPCVTCRSEIGE